MSDFDLRTYSLVLAWNHIHNYWISRGLECEWICDLDQEQQEEEYYRPIREMFAVVRERRKGTSNK